MISPRLVSGIRCKPCDCRMANPSHTGIIAIPPPRNDCAPAGRNRAVRLFCLHFERFVEDRSVITFDYQERFATNAELARAIASGSGRFA